MISKYSNIVNYLIKPQELSPILRTAVHLWKHNEQEYLSAETDQELSQ